MAKEEKIKVTGTIIEALPDCKFRVELENGSVVLGYLAGKIKRAKIEIVPGDNVNIELSPYDLEKGRITYRN